eukprot:jgi/Chlat1/4830/Chrsp31S04868
MWLPAAAVASNSDAPGDTDDMRTVLPRLSFRPVTVGAMSNEAALPPVPHHHAYGPNPSWFSAGGPVPSGSGGGHPSTPMSLPPGAWGMHEAHPHWMRPGNAPPSPPLLAKHNSHAGHKVPSGDGPYVRAKRVQLVEKDPDRAIALFWAAINAGDRTDSALKDMAIVMKQQGRAEEAIEAVRSFRDRCSAAAQESLENVLLDLYKRCGRLEDQVDLLQHKLKMIEQGAAFNGKRTKTARSQGRKFQVSIVQEQTRLLGNLGWAYMQLQNYEAAEAVYRKALDIEPDDNKACNLGICLMRQHRLAEAREILELVNPYGTGRWGSESRQKSYERAQEVLVELDALEAGRAAFQRVGHDFSGRQHGMDVAGSWREVPGFEQEAAVGYDLDESDEDEEGDFESGVSEQLTPTPIPIPLTRSGSSPHDISEQASFGHQASDSHADSGRDSAPADRYTMTASSSPNVSSSSGVRPYHLSTEPQRQGSAPHAGWGRYQSDASEPVASTSGQPPTGGSSRSGESSKGMHPHPSSRSKLTSTAPPWVPAHLAAASPSSCASSLVSSGPPSSLASLASTSRSSFSSTDSSGGRRGLLPHAHMRRDAGVAGSSGAGKDKADENRPSFHRRSSVSIEAERRPHWVADESAGGYTSKPQPAGRRHSVSGVPALDVVSQLAARMHGANVDDADGEASGELTGKERRRLPVFQVLAEEDCAGSAK